MPRRETQGGRLPVARYGFGPGGVLHAGFRNGGHYGGHTVWPSPDMAWLRFRGSKAAGMALRKYF
eukprot:7999722-Alexandrium_andersonii.AAC.1